MSRVGGALALLGVLGLGTVAHAQVDECQERVEKEVRQRHPQAVRIEFTSAEDWQESSVETGVRGEGQFDEDESGDDWTGFSYKCSYDVESGETYGVEIRAEDARAERERDGAFQGDPDRVAIDACQGAVQSEVRRKHEHAGRIEFLGNGAEPVSRAETGVDGTGQFQNKKGDWKKFSYDCVYHVGSGDTSDVKVRD